MTDSDDAYEDSEGRREPPPPGSPPPPDMTLKTPDERKQHLARAIANNIAQGSMRVETQSDFNAVLVKGRGVNHVLHLIITLLTCGLWAVVWVVLYVQQKEKRYMLAIDEYGNVQLERLA